MNAKAEELRHVADIRKLGKCLEETSELYRGLLRERENYDEEEEGEFEFGHDEEKGVTIRFIKDRDSQLPPDEVAAFIDPPSKKTGPRVIRVRKRADIDPVTGEPAEEFLDALSPLWEPLRYPLLFPSGRGGWGLGEGRTILQHFRRVLLRCDRIRQLKALGQAWMVDTYSRVEDERLGFHACQQVKDIPNVPRYSHT